MDKQPEALRLAECLTDYTECTLAEMDQAATELRRLYALNQELLEALKETTGAHELGVFMSGRGLDKYRAAIAKAKEQT